jgi:Rieske Fe-S protein
MSASLVDIQPSDPNKRTWLIASSCAGAVGVGAAAIPFISTFQPSERAKAAGAAVEVDIGGMKPGEKLTVEWRGKPVWIVRRTPEQLATLGKLTSQLADPESKRKPSEFTPEYARNTKVAPSSPSISSRSVSARIWVAHRQINFRQVLSHHCRMTGKADSFALATVQPLILRDGFSRTNQLQTISRCHHICFSLTASC